MINPHRPEFVILPIKKHEAMRREVDKLRALENGGVDNWEWYSESLKPFYRKHYPEDYEDDVDGET